MPIAGDEEGTFLFCEREQVVVAGFAESTWRFRRICGDKGSLAQDRDEVDGFVG